MVPNFDFTIDGDWVTDGDVGHESRILDRCAGHVTRSESPVWPMCACDSWFFGAGRKHPQRFYVRCGPAVSQHSAVTGFPMAISSRRTRREARKLVNQVGTCILCGVR